MPEEDEELPRLSELQVDAKPRPIDQDARDEALRAELAGVHQINTVIEGVVASLEKAKENMEVVPTPVTFSPN